MFAVIDAVFVLLLAWRIGSAAFRNMKWPLAFTSAVFWFALFITVMSWIFWEPVYHYVFPSWARWLVPPVYGVLFGGVSILFWWLALRIPGNVVVNYCILGGLWGMITHIWGIHRGLLDKPPMLQGVSPLSASVMPIFEFIFYWCIILSVASLFYRLRRRRRSRR